jgi:hypothetical protein
MDALDINRDQYVKVFECEKHYKRSFAKITIMRYENEFFFGLNCLLAGPNLHRGHSFAALRKWGTYTSLIECKRNAVKEVKKMAVTEQEKAIVNKLDLSLYRQGELF